jgi:Epoxide hydrolase N terminus
MPALRSSSARRDILAPSVAACAIGLMPAMPRASESDAVHPFRISIAQETLDDLRRWIAAARWSDRETVNDRSQGVQLGRFQELVLYWGTDYDWRKTEAKLNALPQLMTSIDGLDFHYIHVRSRQPNALPLLIAPRMAGIVLRARRIDRPAHRSNGVRRDLAPGGHHGISGGVLSRPGNMGPARLSQSDLTFTRSKKEATSQPGNSPSCSPPSSAPRSAHSVRRTD